MKKVKSSAIRKELIRCDGGAKSYREMLSSPDFKNAVRWNLWEGVSHYSTHKGICELVLGETNKARISFQEAALAGKEAFSESLKIKGEENKPTILIVGGFLEQVLHSALASKEFKLAQDLARSLPSPTEGKIDTWEYLPKLRNLILKAEEVNQKPPLEPYDYEGEYGKQIRLFHTYILSAVGSLKSKDQSRFVFNLKKTLDVYKKSSHSRGLNSWVCLPVFALKELGNFYSVQTEDVNPILAEPSD